MNRSFCTSFKRSANTIGTQKPNTRLYTLKRMVFRISRPKYLPLMKVAKCLKPTHLIFSVSEKKGIPGE